MLMPIDCVYPLGSSTWISLFYVASVVSGCVCFSRLDATNQSVPDDARPSINAWVTEKSARQQSGHFIVTRIKTKNDSNIKTASICTIVTFTSRRSNAPLLLF